MPILHQKPGQSLYPDVEWSKPENKAQAGKLLIIGGNVHGIAAPGQAYMFANENGAGEVKVVLPDAAKKVLPKNFLDVEFVSSTPSGSFSQQALSDLQAFVSSADGTLFCGDFGRNSETAIVLEDLVKKAGLMVFTKDALDYFLANPQPLLNRPETILVASFAQAQKIAKNAAFHQALVFSDAPLQIAQKLADFSADKQAIIVTEKNGVIFLAARGQVIQTNFRRELSSWRLKLASSITVWATPNQTKRFEACAVAISQFS